MVILQKHIWIQQTVIFFPERERSIRESLRQSEEVIEGNAHGYFIQGKIMVATANPDKMKEYEEEMI